MTRGGHGRRSSPSRALSCPHRTSDGRAGSGLASRLLRQGEAGLCARSIGALKRRPRRASAAPRLRRSHPWRSGSLSESAPAWACMTTPAASGSIRPVSGQEESSCGLGSRDSRSRPYRCSPLRPAHPPRHPCPITEAVQISEPTSRFSPKRSEATSAAPPPRARAQERVCSLRPWCGRSKLPSAPRADARRSRHVEDRQRRTHRSVPIPARTSAALELRRFLHARPD
jgi:hypothetical protein